MERIRTDGEFVREHRLDALRETLVLDYPSYILALAMGAGKTILIGAIIATEFALAHEYGPEAGFIENALVFAPGTTIIESLRELARTPYDRILPPRLHEPFAAALKMTARRNDPVEGTDGLKARALESLAEQNSHLLSYRMVFADVDVDPRDMARVREFLAS